MKKHFLILMLMALLPLSGWAADLEVSKFVARNISYGSGVDAISVRVVPEGAYEEGDFVVNVDEFYGSNADETINLATVIAAEDLETTSVGKYWIKITGGVGSDYEGQTIYVSFWINPAKIFITFAEGQGKEYGSPDPDFEYTLYDGDENEITDEDFIEALELNIGRDLTAENPENAGDYAFTYLAGTDNYTLLRSDGDETVFTIAPKNIAESIDVLLAEGTWTYNGTNQGPDITVMDGTDEIEDAADQFEFAYSYATTADGDYGETEENAHANAGFYMITVTAVDGGNYTLEGAEDPIIAGPFQIAQAPLQVYVNNAEKDYDGDNAIPDGVTVAFSGLKGADASNPAPFGDEAFTVYYKTTAEPGTAGYDEEIATNMNVKDGGYQLVPVQVNPTENINNYEVNTLATGVLTVNPLEITVKPADAEKELDAADPDFVVEISEGEALEADVETITGAYEVTREEGEALKDDYTMTATLKAELDDETTTTLNNYDITLETGTFSIVAGTLYVYPQSKAVIYNGEAADLSNINIVATTAGGTKVSLTNLSDLSVKFKDEEWATENPKNADTYEITVDGTPTAEGYTADKIVKLDGQFTISPKDLTITLAAQTLNVGDALSQDESMVNFDGLVEGDHIQFELGFSEDIIIEDDPAIVEFDDEAEVFVIAEGALDQTYAEGIIISVPVEADEEYANTNYNIVTEEVFGKLIVGAGGTEGMVLDPAAEDAEELPAAVIEEHAGETLDVTFAEGAVTMNEKEWYAMVLPFETTPAEIVSALGTYVVVNKIKSSTMDEEGVVDVQFGLEWDKIDAGEPFLIKPATDIDWARFDEGDGPLAVAAPTFIDKLIVSEITNAVTDKATFAGTYATDESVKWGLDTDGATADATAKYRWLAHKEYGKGNTWLNPKKNAHDLAPMEAYLILDPAAEKARIFVEDVDENGATAIKSLSVDKVNGLNVEGMYTIGGMKLQGAPTQKGVYIKDGKKVIIK